MFFRKKNQEARAGNEYASRRDFEKIFTQDMASLHLLAFLLTADQARAEQCFVAGLEDSIHANPVFKEWAHAWSKRAIIKRAITVAAPLPGGQDPATVQLHPQNRDPKTEDPEMDAVAAAVLSLPALERFVFVLSVLEGYSLPECAVLLGCTPRQVVAARSESLRKVNIRLAHEPFTPPSFVAAWKSLFNSAHAA